MTTTSSLHRLRTLNHAFSRFTLAALLFAGGFALAAAQSSAPLRLLFDDYYQKIRDDSLYQQGVARGDADLRNLSNFYSPDANAIPNGAFVFSDLISDKFAVEISHAPISSELLQEVGAYMLVCPVNVASGGRADLTEVDAEILEKFVAGGGRLIVVANSMPDPTKSGLDFVGMNRIARRFGVQFLGKQTDTLSIPIANDHPIFDGVPGIIFGNGTTLEVLPSASADTTVILAADHGSSPGPVGVIASHGEGKALFFGDAGTFGNAHTFRDDLGHDRALRQMMFALLPDGPAPRYRFSEDTKLRVKIQQEQILSGYPEWMRVFNLPRNKGGLIYTSGMRQIDLEASGGSATNFASHDFVSVVANQAVDLHLAIGAANGRSHALSFQQGDDSLRARILPSGRIIDPAVPSSRDLAAWQATLTNELILGPLKPYALPGESWPAAGLAAVPQLQLTTSPHFVSADSTITFEGPRDYQGRPCFLFRKVTRLNGKNWAPESLVSPEYAMQFNSREIAILAAGLHSVAHYWVSADSLLPVRTEIKVASALWWKDDRFPARYLGTHDSMNYENWETKNFNATYGRTLTADFEVE